MVPPNYMSIEYTLKNCMNCGRVVMFRIGEDEEVECRCGNTVKLEEVEE